MHRMHRCRMMAQSGVLTDQDFLLLEAPFAFSTETIGW